MNQHDNQASNHFGKDRLTMATYFLQCRFPLILLQCTFRQQAKVYPHHVLYNMLSSTRFHQLVALCINSDTQPMVRGKCFQFHQHHELWYQTFQFLETLFIMSYKHVSSWMKTLPKIVFLFFSSFDSIISCVRTEDVWAEKLMYTGTYPASSWTLFSNPRATTDCKLQTQKCIKISGCCMQLKRKVVHYFCRKLYYIALNLKKKKFYGYFVDFYPTLKGCYNVKNCVLVQTIATTEWHTFNKIKGCLFLFHYFTIHGKISPSKENCKF